MIDRSFVDKLLPAFEVELSEKLCIDFTSLFDASGYCAPPPNWPAILTLHGTAALLSVWEALGVDPLSAKLLRERFLHVKPPPLGQVLSGHLRIGEIREYLNSDGKIEEEVDMHTLFVDSSKELIAEYYCTFRISY
jgi:hypothetical protein